MKTKITLILVLFFCSLNYAQNNFINYKALVKDSNGNVALSQPYELIFTIKEGNTTLYEENHFGSTDANGIIILDIGSGTPTGASFNTVDWDSGTLTLGVAIVLDSGTGFVDLGTTEFKSVPYALSSADTVFKVTNNVTSNTNGDIENDDFVFGSTQLDHSAEEFVADNRMIFDKSKGAFRAGMTSNIGIADPTEDGTAWNNTNLGEYSFAVGENTMASGEHSIAMGKSTAASGNKSTAMGNRTEAIGSQSTAMGGLTTASGDFSTSMGLGTTASGVSSTAMGQGTIAGSVTSVAIGRYNIGGATTPLYPVSPTDPLFEIGNGINGAPSNAMTVLQNGNTTINGKTIINEPTTSDTEHAISGIKTHTGNSDANGVLGQNNVSDFYGIGVKGIGGWRGVSGEVSGTGSSSYYGIYGGSIGNNIGTNYGVFGIAGNGGTNYAVYASGDLAYTGTLTNLSDRKFKSNIATMENSLEAILNLRPSTYTIKASYQKSMNMSKKPQFGFIAQELQEVFPDLISQNVHPGETKDAAPIEYLGVNYIGLIPILTKGIQEQQEEIDALETKLDTQQQTIEALLARVEALENN